MLMLNFLKQFLPILSRKQMLMFLKHTNIFTLEYSRFKLKQFSYKDGTLFYWMDHFSKKMLNMYVEIKIYKTIAKFCYSFQGIKI